MTNLPKEMTDILPTEIITIFKLMEIAEEEIQAAVETRPLESVTINRTFRLCCPKMVLFGSRHPDLYRSHVRELIERVVNGDDTRPGTKAEVLATLSQISFVSTLVDSAHTLMARLMKEVMPGYEPPTDDNWIAQEPWPGAVDKELAGMRHKLVDPERLLESAPGGGA